jgi:hypothetical protein
MWPNYARNRVATLALCLPIALIGCQAEEDAKGAKLKAQARPAVSIDDTEHFRSNVDSFLNAAHRKAGFSGAVIVARSGQPIYQSAIGLSQLKSKTPNTVDTPFGDISPCRPR